jgi:hypothetical protein
MLAALNALSSDYSFTVEVVDVDANEALIAQYDELVPVLAASRDGARAVPLCHYFLDEKAVRAFLAGD